VAVAGRASIAETPAVSAVGASDHPARSEAGVDVVVMGFASALHEFADHLVESVALRACQIGAIAVRGAGAFGIHVSLAIMPPWSSVASPVGATRERGVKGR
jgi:hypothetical protein